MEDNTQEVVDKNKKTFTVEEVAKMRAEENLQAHADEHGGQVITRKDVTFDKVRQGQLVEPGVEHGLAPEDQDLLEAMHKQHEEDSLAYTPEKAAKQAKAAENLNQAMRMVGAVKVDPNSAPFGTVGSAPKAPEPVKLPKEVVMVLENHQLKMQNIQLQLQILNVEVQKAIEARNSLAKAMEEIRAKIIADYKVDIAMSRIDDAGVVHQLSPQEMQRMMAQMGGGGS